VLSQRDFVVSLLVEEGILSQEALELATRHASENRVSVPDAAIAIGAVTSRQVAIARGAVCECPFVDLSHYEINLKYAALLPRSAAEKQAAFPLFDLGKSITVGMADPMDLRGVDRLRALLKTDIETVLCEPQAIRSLIERAYSMTGGRNSPAENAAAPDVKVNGEEPIVAAVNQIIIQAIEQNASDIHIGPDEHELHLRYRIDGSLQHREGPALSSHPGLVQRLKVMANLDLTQTRRPQDGKFRFQHNGRGVDMRLSIIPTVSGENVVIRVLSGQVVLGDLGEMGFTPDIAAAAEETIERPYGMVLVTGPTGSGKTTTLYSFLKKLNTPDRNVVTIEDPVEIRMPMVRQVQVHTEIGMTFAGALRSILRQDPDVILLGEIRDEETARIAVQSALTGHLVLSTLHTNDAPGAVARLRDFGCAGFAINAAVLSVIAQRLVRRICPECVQPCHPPERILRRFGHQDGGQFRRGAGCARCLNTGFRGRVGVFEMLRMTPTVQLAIERNASTAAIRRLAIREGMRPIWQDGLEKACLGLTTLDEVTNSVAGSLENDTAETGPVAQEGPEDQSSVRLSA
jgi:type IV pilus assembly protein PilB